jgi:hypothetical protein
MDLTCPRCRTASPVRATQCGRCGLPLTGDAAHGRAGRVAHPLPWPAPAGFSPIRDANDLYARWQSAWGPQHLLGTEPLQIVVFNAGYPLCEVRLRIVGWDASNQGALDTHHEIERWDSGQTITFEVASYDIRSPLVDLTVALDTAEFAPSPDARGKG